MNKTGFEKVDEMINKMSPEKRESFLAIKFAQENKDPLMDELLEITRRRNEIKKELIRKYHDCLNSNTK